MYLSVEDYDAAERQALLAMPNRIVECCMPVAFQQESYPTRISMTKAAGRYVDVMQEGRSEDTFSFLLRGIAPKEMECMRSVAGKVAALTEQLYGRRMVPRSGLLRALNVVRHIRYLHPQPSATILEIGGGSGYVGALLLELGYRYVGTDITQAFYIWQSHLMTALAGGDLVELATAQQDFLTAPELSRASHVPWWKFVVPQPDVRARVDVVTCNHTLCEMHPIGQAYSLAVAHSMLEGGGTRCFLFEGWGSTIRRQIWHTGKAFAEAGFVFAHNDIFSSIPVRSDSPAALHAMSLPLAAPDDAHDEVRYHPNIHVNDRNEITRIVLEERAKTEKNATLAMADFDAMLRSELGSDELSTDDERFMRFVQDWRH
jgi:SAM-dependent methyltransferase